MRHAEQVTFGGSGLDRSAALRGNEIEQAKMLLSGRVLPFWRGMPLIEAGSRLGWLRHDSPVLEGGEPVVFLGLDEGRPCFAQDISHWSPEAGAASDEAGLFDLTLQTHPALESHFAFQDLRNVMVLLPPCDAELGAMAKGVLLWHRSHGFCAACSARSVPAQSGWQRDCPACGAHHFPRTDPVVIMLVERGNRLLLGRSAAWPEGMYSLLAGFVEPGETIEAAVRREVFEESGILVQEVRYLASQPWPFPASLMFGCHARATSDTITLDPAELEDARWVTREEMVQVLTGEHPVIKPGRKGAIAHFLISNWLADRLN